MRAVEFTNEDLSRRNFLGGVLGTASGLGAADAEAAKKKPHNSHDKDAQAMNTKIDSKYQLSPGDELPVLSNKVRFSFLLVLLFFNLFQKTFQFLNRYIVFFYQKGNHIAEGSFKIIFSQLLYASF